MAYLGKGEMLANRDVNKFERNKLFVHIEHFWDLISDHETWDQDFMCVYIFKMYNQGSPYDILTRWG